MSEKMTLGKGAPYALSMISGILLSLAIFLSLSISSSVRTFPEGLVGRETQIAAISSPGFTASKSTLYLNSCGPVFSMRAGSASKKSELTD